MKNSYTVHSSLDHSSPLTVHCSRLTTNDSLLTQSLTWLLKNNWIAGYCYNGKYVNEKTINYVSKYLTKLDEVNRDFTGKVLCSKGLGASYVERNKKRFEWKGEETKTYIS